MSHFRSNIATTRALDRNVTSQQTTYSVTECNLGKALSFHELRTTVKSFIVRVSDHLAFDDRFYRELELSSTKRRLNWKVVKFFDQPELPILNEMQIIFFANFTHVKSKSIVNVNYIVAD